jgi:Ca2+-binding RTX toxin-like protein
MIARTAAVAGLVVATLGSVSPSAHAGPVRVRFDGDRLTVVGNDSDNTITITRLAGGVRVVVDGTQVKLRPRPTPSTLDSIKVKGRGGNDVVTLVESAGPLPDASLQGGRGDDRLTAGSGATRLVGRAGDDVLVGGAGPTVMYGGDGADHLTGGSGPTTLSGGPGNDVAAASSGNTVMRGDDGDDTLTAGSSGVTMDGGAGDDTLTGGNGFAAMAGGTGDDAYSIDGDTASGLLSVTEAAGAGTDRMSFAGTTTVGVSLDLSVTSAQAATGALLIQLSSGTGIENVVGGAQADTFTGNSLVNTFSGASGGDTFVHRGAGGGIDRAVDMSVTEGDQVQFITGGAASADDFVLDSGATQLRGPGATFGFDFTAAVLNGAGLYIYGTTDTAPAGQLITFSGVGGFGQGSNVNSLITNHASNGSTIAGAGGNDRIIDHSPNGNSLVGRDGTDILDGGAGADTLQGDRGFAPGVSDTYTGGPGADTFKMGEAFGGGALETFGDDTFTDFGVGGDTVDLFTGLSVRSGLATSTVTIWDGATDFGTITAANGHLWAAGDFS